MARKKDSTIKPFEELSKLYQKYGEVIDNVIIFLIQGILFVLTLIVAFAVLIATGLFVF